MMAGGVGGVEAGVAALGQLVGRQLAQEARGDGRLPLVEHAPVGGEGDIGPLARPRQADIGQPPLLLEPGQALVVERALVGEQAFLPARQEHGVELQSLGGMQRHDAHHVGVAAVGHVGQQRHVLEESGQGVELLQRVGQLLEVFQPALGFGRAVEAQHVGVAQLVEDGLDHLDMVHAVEHGAPAVEAADEVAQRLARPGLQLVGLERPARRLDQRDLLGALDQAQGAQRRFAQPAARRVVDALEGKVVVGLHRDPAIGQRVADLLALVEARPADHPVGQAHGDEAFLELAGLEAGAHQDGDLGQLVLVALQGLDLLADRARLLVAVPHAAQRDALALLDLGPQRLAQPSLVVGDQVRGGGQDVRRRTVVALQPHDGGAGKILLEAQDVADLRAAPAVDRLVVVADAADVLRCPGPAA